MRRKDDKSHTVFTSSLEKLGDAETAEFAHSEICLLQTEASSRGGESQVATLCRFWPNQRV